MHALELRLCTNVLSSCFVHEMHEMSNHNIKQVDADTKLCFCCYEIGVSLNLELKLKTIQQSN